MTLSLADSGKFAISNAFSAELNELFKGMGAAFHKERKAWLLDMAKYEVPAPRAHSHPRRAPCASCNAWGPIFHWTQSRPL